MHEYRPRLSLKRSSPFLKFAASVLPYNLGLFLTGKADVIIVGRVAKAAYLGAYSVASELAGTFTREVVMSVGRGLIPNYAKLTNDRSRLSEMFLVVLGSSALVCVALGMGLASVASEFVTVVLGSQWLHAVPVLRWLAVYGIMVSVSETLTGNVLIVTGKERLSAWLMWVRLGFLIPLTIAASMIGGAELVAASATLSAALFLPIAILSLAHSVGIPATKLLSTLWRPTIAGAAMAAFVWHFPVPLPSVLVVLIGKILLGGIVYFLAILILWWLAGKPAGIERIAATYVAQRWGVPRQVAGSR
jgi:O-antigen/teichoic acid export membrane protein